MFSMYSTYSIKDLKFELKQRNAKQSGRKAELVERLEAYDRNFNFGCKTTALVETLTLPERAMYSDVNSSCLFPALTEEKIKCFLTPFSKNIDQKPIQMYYSQYLLYMRWAKVSTGFFIHAACKAELKKKTRYDIDVCLSEHGEVKSAQCECVAGAAPTAHCKHVITVLIGVSNGHPVITSETCTQKLQSFHKPCKSYTGSPVKAGNIPTKKFSIEGISTSKRMLSYDPRPEEFVKKPGYNDQVRNLTINFAQQQPRMPISHLIEPANPYALDHDHDYLQQLLSETYLDKMTKLNFEGKRRLEESTRAQGNSKIWIEERCLRTHSSNFGIICKATERLNLNKLAERMCYPKEFTSKPIAHGRNNEKIAITKYEEFFGEKVQRCGILIHKTYPYLGTSLDGIVIGKDKIIEVKCPYVSRNMMILPETVPYIYKCPDGELKLAATHNYMFQIQGQLEISERSQCDLVLYTFKDIVVINIKRDRNFFERMLPKLIDFYISYQKPTLIEKYFYRKYEMYKF